jgi:hypothetical protein
LQVVHGERVPVVHEIVVVPSVRVRARAQPETHAKAVLVVRQPAGRRIDRNGPSAFSGLSARAEPATAEKGLADPRSAPQPRCDLSGQAKHQSDSNAAFEAVSGLPRAGGITNRMQVITAGGD